MRYLQLLVLLILAGSAFLGPSKVQAVCDSTCPGNCISCDYTTYYDCGYPILASLQCSITNPSTCCHITFTGGGGCTYCDTTNNCYINGCSSGGGPGEGGGPTATPIPTPIPTVPPGTCINMSYCYTGTGVGECRGTTNLYNSSSHVDCAPPNNTCETNIATVPSLVGKTTGVCYTSSAACVDVCVPVPARCSTFVNNCDAGTLGATQEYSDQWQWWCMGKNGGANVLCAKAKPTPTPAPNPPYGNHDAATCTVFSGWACDPDYSYASSVQVQFFDGPGFGSYIGQTTTGQSRPDVNSYGGFGWCGSNTNSGFSFATPDALKNGVNHTIYGYAIDPLGGAYNQVLWNSGITINCPSPTPIPPGVTITPTATLTPTIPVPSITPSPTPSPTPTPIPVGTIRARAVKVDPTDTTCTAIRAVSTSATDISGTVLGFTINSKNQPSPQTQSGADYVTFTNQPIGAYTLDTQVPSANWILAGGCWSSSDGSANTGASSTLSDGETITWDMGYMLGSPWIQSEGGDVYASGTIKSFVPAVVPRVFSVDGAGGDPGVVTYGTSYDFDGLSISQGDTYISSANWLADATRTTVDYYDYFYNRLGKPSVTDNALFPNLNAVSKPASRATPYYISGNMTTNGNWTIGSGESVVFIVTGNITIGGKITITPGGFAAFIAKGDISISSNVGTTYVSTASVLDGLYVTSPAGTFATGTSSVVNKERLVGKGMFIAGNFLLQRDLESVNANTLAAAELFIYDPRLLFTMPEDMLELPVVWQEVVP